MAAPSAVFTIARVAEMLGEDVDWLSDVALEMEPEDGCLTVYDVGNNDEGVTIAFTPLRDRQPQGTHRDPQGQSEHH